MLLGGIFIVHSELDIENRFKELTFFMLAMYKHCLDYKPDFLETINEDAQDMFKIIKEAYEEGKRTNASFTPKLEKLINSLEKYFD